MRIDKHRVAVNVGDIMDQKRVQYSLPNQVRSRMSDWLAEICDEQAIMTASGARGDGDEVQHYPVGYEGFPNAFRAPDAQHYMVYDGSRANAAALTAGDTLSTLVLDKLKLRTTKQLGGIDIGKPIKMEPVQVGGGKYFLYMASPESMFDLRRDEGPSGWLTLEKARMAAVGNDSPIVKGSKIMHNNVLVDEMETVVKFGTGYGAGGALGATRNLFFGANAVAVAWGSKERKKDGNRFEFLDADEDYGEEDVIVVRMVAGWDKCNYAGQDFGVIANDISFTKST
jgi:N4-gp56 family major capsid protein